MIPEASSCDFRSKTEIRFHDFDCTYEIFLPVSPEQGPATWAHGRQMSSDLFVRLRTGPKLLGIVENNTATTRPGKGDVTSRPNKLFRSGLIVNSTAFFHSSQLAPK